MKILAIDTATDACSAALMIEGNIITQYEVAPQQHARLILPMIESLLNTADITLNALDALAFGRGPGSFTGVRIASSVIQALAFGADLQVIPVSSLQALAQSAYRHYQATTVCAAIDARMQEIYYGCYQFSLSAKCLLPLTSETLAKSDAISLTIPENAVGIGSGWSTKLSDTIHSLAFKEIYPAHYPNAEDILPLAEYYYKQGKVVPAEEALPVYMRDNVAAPPKRLIQHRGE